MAEYKAPFQIEDELDFEGTIEAQDDGSYLVGDVDPFAPIEPSLREFDDNLVSSLSEKDATTLGSEMVSDYKKDVAARADWLRVYKSGLESLMPEELATSSVPAGASSRHMSKVIHPMIAEAATEFQARAIGELFPPDGPVGTKIVGDATEEIQDQSDRVRNFMNYQLTEEMEEYFPDLDQMLFHLPLVGQTWKKCWFDVNLGRVATQFVEAENFVIEANAKSLRSATRYSEDMYLFRHDFDRYVANGFYDNLDDGVTGDNYPTSTTQNIDGVDATQEDNDESPSDLLHFIETHRYLDLESEEGEPGRPYVVTTHEPTQQIVSIRRNWDEDDTKYRKNTWYVGYRFLPGLGAYGFGLYHVIGGLGKAATGALRALLDAAAFANLQGGFKLKGHVPGGEMEMNPGEFMDISAPVDDIKKAIMPFPFKEPSQAMMLLLQYIVEAGKRFASTTEMNVSDANQNTPVGTTMALLEEGSRVFSAIHKRLHRAQGEEFKLIAKLNGIYLPESYPYRTGSEDFVLREDFDTRVDVIPVSDPATFSSTQRIAQAQATLELSEKYPEFHNKFNAIENMYKALRVPNHDHFLINPENAVRQDAVAENVAMMHQRPVRVFEDQDHMAHITVLDGWFAQVPPDMQQLYMPRFMSHRSEHMSYYYRAQVQAQLHAPLPPIMLDQDDQQPIPPQLDAQISQAAAQMIMQNPQQPIGPNPPKPGGPEGEQQDPMAIARMLAETEAMALQVKTKAGIESDQMKAQSRLQMDWAKHEMDMKIDQIKAQAKADEDRIRAMSDAQSDAKETDQKIRMMWETAHAQIAIAHQKANKAMMDSVHASHVEARRKEHEHQEEMFNNRGEE